MFVLGPSPEAPTAAPKILPVATLKTEPKLIPSVPYIPKAFPISPILFFKSVLGLTLDNALRPDKPGLLASYLSATPIPEPKIDSPLTPV